MNIRQGRRLVTLLLALPVLALAACTTGNPQGTQQVRPTSFTVAPDPAAVALLPEDVRKSGTLVVAMDASQGEPITFYSADDNRTVIGVTGDIERGIGQALGLRIDTRATSFENLIPGLLAGRYDLSIAPMLMLPKRLERVDMIGWLHGGSAFLVDREKGRRDLTLETACGLTVGAATGSAEATALAGQSSACTKNGKPAIVVNLYPHATDGIVALRAGRLDAYDTAAAQAAYAAKVDPRLTQAEGSHATGTSAMALPKGSEIAPAVEAAFQHLIDTGVYGQILRTYGLEDLAVPSSSLNEAV